MFSRTMIVLALAPILVFGAFAFYHLFNLVCSNYYYFPCTRVFSASLPVPSLDHSDLGFIISGSIIRFNDLDNVCYVYYDSSSTSLSCVKL